MKLHLNKFESSNIDSILLNGTTIILDPSSSWEVSYLTNELFPNYLNIIKPNSKDFLNFQFYKKFDNIIGNNIFVFNSNKHSYYKLSAFATKIKPIIITNLADDKGNRENYERLSLLCTLYLRQYNHQHYIRYPNTLHIPLGYSTDMFKDEKSTSNYESHLNNNRTIIWSFIGNMKKQDRPYMINTLKTLTPNVYTNEMTPNEMMKIYSKSIFTPNGKGWQLIDCFRLYEASSSGSIPVVVGTKEEIFNTIEFMDKPPWIYTSTWSEAYEIMNKLKNKPELLQSKSKNILLWWKKINNKIKKRIVDVLPIENNKDKYIYDYKKRKNTIII
jgi:hypothetical protein